MNVFSAFENIYFSFENKYFACFKQWKLKVNVK